MIEITKKLQRTDKGTVSAGSIIDYKVIRYNDSLKVRYNLTHWFNVLAKEEAKEKEWLPIQKITNFDYILIKECTKEEYSKLNKAGSFELEEQWLKELIDAKIGAGFTKTI